MKEISDDAFKLLVEKMGDFLELGVEFKRALRSKLLETTYSKGTTILGFGQRQYMVWFILDGLAREVRVDEYSYVEKTIWFWFPFSFLYTNGFFSQQTSESAIEVLQDCHVALIRYEHWAELKTLFMETEQVTEMIRAANDRVRWHHAEQISNMTAEKRYRENKVILSKLFRMTKRKYIAEFMGMSVGRLGKLRSKF